MGKIISKAVMTLVVLVLMIVFINNLISNIKLDKHGRETEAEIKSIEKDRDYDGDVEYILTLVYTVNGTSYEVKTTTYQLYIAGDTIRIRYQTDNPKNFKLTGKKENVSPFFTYLIIFMFVVVLIALYVKPKSKKEINNDSI
jgi:uncharacterized membrane protein